MGRLKIKQEHLEYLKTEINKVLIKYPKLVDEYEHGDFPRADKVKDLQKRFSFDLLYGAGLTKWVCDNIYPYANDDHIYSALKTFCPKVVKHYD